MEQKFYAYKSVASGKFYTWNQMCVAYSFALGRFPHNEEVVLWISQKIDDGFYQEYEVSKTDHEKITRGEDLL